MLFPYELLSIEEGARSAQLQFYWIFQFDHSEYIAIRVRLSILQIPQLNMTHIHQTPSRQQIRIYFHVRSMWAQLLLVVNTVHHFASLLSLKFLQYEVISSYKTTQAELEKHIAVPKIPNP